jgi:epoxyqueuosine reductase
VSPNSPTAGPDPIDRWSRRVIGHMACDLGAKALFPFGGPPWHPFIAWAKRSGRAWESPVGFLVHDRAG